jgi:hypothetical protein
VKYIDHHGKEQTISEEVEKQFAAQNKNWVPFEYSIIAICAIAIITGLWSVYEKLPK